MKKAHINSKNVSLRIDLDMLAVLKARARKTGMSFRALVIKCLSREIQENETEIANENRID